VMRTVCDVAVLTRNGDSLLCLNGEVNSTGLAELLLSDSLP
jgi:hypothetical protein